MSARRLAWSSSASTAAWGSSPLPFRRWERSHATSCRSGSLTVSGAVMPQMLGGKRPRGVRGAQAVDDDRDVALPGLRALVRLARGRPDAAHEHDDAGEAHAGAQYPRLVGAGDQRGHRRAQILLDLGALED